MRNWATRLRDDLGIAALAANELASTIAREVKNVGKSGLSDLMKDAPIPFQERLDELSAFQAWMDFAGSIRGNPAATRAQVITQNYVCFVYLGDAWFKRLGKVVVAGSVTKKCCKFLTDNPVCVFRNAVAHTNRKYNDSFTELEFWARKGADATEPMEHFEVAQNDLHFWQAIARCTAYASFLAAKDAD